MGRLYLAHGKDRVLRFRADGTFAAALGLPGALRVLCPPLGSCFAVGRGATLGDGYVERLEW